MEEAATPAQDAAPPLFRATTAPLDRRWVGHTDVSHTTVLMFVRGLQVVMLTAPPEGTEMLYHTSDDACPKKLFLACCRPAVEPDTTPGTGWWW